jgi:hypothetical protein
MARQSPTRSLSRSAAVIGVLMRRSRIIPEDPAREMNVWRDGRHEKLL